jgi:hypothetical protein
LDAVHYELDTVLLDSEKTIEKTCRLAPALAV